MGAGVGGSTDAGAEEPVSAGSSRDVFTAGLKLTIEQLLNRRVSRAATSTRKTARSGLPGPEGIRFFCMAISVSPPDVVDRGYAYLCG
ncbi:hypothetical protein GCM10009636_23120 [Arthrobacter koreensis]